MKCISHALPKMKILSYDIAGLLEQNFHEIGKFLGASDADINSSIELALSKNDSELFGRPLTVAEVLNQKNEEPNLGQQLRGVRTRAESEIADFVHKVYSDNANLKPMDKDFSQIGKLLSEGFRESMQNCEQTEKTDNYNKLLDVAITDVCSKMSADRASQKAREEALKNQWKSRRRY